MLRRSFIKGALGWPLSGYLGMAMGQASLVGAIQNTSAWRRALILGNGAYTKPHDLPSASANVAQLSQSLGALGFQVFDFVDLSTESLALQVQRFVTQMNDAPAGSVSLVYFVGHGVQAQSQNYLLGIEIEPTLDQGELINQAFSVESQWIGLLPERQDCLQVAIIDACRTDANQLFESRQTGLNQIEAPPGSIVSFSTQAGRPAIAPADAQKLTFYTQALVDQLMEWGSFSTFGDLLRLVKRRVYQNMRAHPLPLIQALAQDPFIAENAMSQLALGKTKESLAQSEQDSWEAILKSAWPPTLLERVERFVKRYPKSSKLPLARVYRDGAQLALSVLMQPSIRLYKSSFSLPDALNDSKAEQDLARSARGDKDAAARIARIYRQNPDSRSQLRYEGWLQFATGLGNGIAAYELALLYRELNLPQPAASAEAKAIELGYVPPRGLGHDR